MTALEEYEKWKRYQPGAWMGGYVTQRKADAAIESLKCCGNCEDGRGNLCANEARCIDNGADWDGYINVATYDPCHFTPSRWQERKP